MRTCSHKLPHTPTRKRLKALLALDRSLRAVDEDGHMRVEMSRISKAAVNPYKGSEIPNFKALGLDPEKIYKLFRDPEELKKGADTFTGKPLLMDHVPVTAELPSKELWCGTLGQVTWEAPYLVSRPLMVWTQEAIDAIESLDPDEQKRELSAAYRYDAEMVPGIFGGEAFDGRMVNIRGNHTATVSEGRAGSDVLVADELPMEFREMKKSAAAVAAKALAPHLKGLKGITPAVRKAIAIALDGALGEVPVEVGKKTGLDAFPLDDKEKKAAEDAFKEMKGMDASEELSDEDKEFAYNEACKAKDKARDESQNHAGDDEGDMDDEKAADALADPDDHRRDFRSGDRAHDSKNGVTQDQMNEAVKAGVALARKQERDLSIARDAVRPIVGNACIAMDSADEVYAYTLGKLGIDVKKKGIHPSAFAALFESVSTRAPRGEPAVALDSSNAELVDLDKIFCKPSRSAADATH